VESKDSSFKQSLVMKIVTYLNRASFEKHLFKTAIRTLEPIDPCVDSLTLRTSGYGYSRRDLKCLWGPAKTSDASLAFGLEALIEFHNARPQCLDWHTFMFSRGVREQEKRIIDFYRHTLPFNPFEVGLNLTMSETQNEEE